MEDYDVIIVGGGVNGLTAAAYLAKSGIKTVVLEARGECGAHCDTTEPGIPGFVHNLHATWLISAISPCIEDLELASRFGLEHVATEYCYGKTFEDGKNVLMGVDPVETFNSWEKHSEKDGLLFMQAADYMTNNLEETQKIFHDFLFKAPSKEILRSTGDVIEGILSSCDIDLTFDQVWNMNGFDLTKQLFESEYIRTQIQTFSWIAGMPPIHPNVGSMGALLTMMCGPFFPVHQAKGGAHALTHALVKAATAYGATILPCCPVKEIITKNGEAVAVKLSEHAVFPSETISAKKIISNCTLIPTFKYMVGYDNIDSDMASMIDKFDYNEQNLFATYWALDGAPQFASADYDDGIQRCFMGYFGGKNTEELTRFNTDLVNRVIHPDIQANWMIPSLTDPTQAPEGCHTAFVWLDAPPQPKSWKHGSLNGLPAWDEIKYEMADQVVDTFEKYAPGFKKLIKEQIIYTPYDMQRNNPSAVLGNWLGGSVIPEQWYMKRPVQGVLKGGGSRTFLKNLYLSNSIHLFSYSGLSSGYIAASEVAEDLGVREQGWWNSKALDWYLDNINDIPLNLGVR